jgi:hypothetical protein
MPGPKMKYRLALKLAEPEIGEAALGWAMLRLKDEAPETGSARLPYRRLRGRGEVRVLVYTDPADMIDPMPIDDHEYRLKMLSGTLPDECEIVRVLFDKPAYLAWLGDRLDNHQARSEWALQVPPATDRDMTAL